MMQPWLRRVDWVSFLLECAAGALGILAKHRPRALGGAFGIGLDGIELFVV